MVAKLTARQALFGCRLTTTTSLTAVSDAWRPDGYAAASHSSTSN